MRSMHIYLEYLLLFLITASSLSFAYMYYQNNKETISNIFRNREEEMSFNKINNLINYVIYFYNSSIEFNLNINGMCKYNYVIFYKSSFCYPETLNISYSGDIIKVNNTYYLYSNTTELYYLMYYKTPISLEGCYESRYSYIILTSNCLGICINKCNVRVEKVGKNITIYLT